MSDAFTRLSYALATLVCLLTTGGLRRGCRKDETWLPSFAASTTFKAFVFKAFVFWVACAAVPLWIRAYHTGDNMVEFGMFLLFPAVILIFWLVPKARRTLTATINRTRAMRFANVALFCVGFLIVGVVAITG